MPESNEISRRNPEMEKYVSIHENRITLQVDNQFFRLDYKAESQETAEWMRDMLCIALAKLVKQEVRNGQASDS